MHMGALLEEIRRATALSKGFRNVASHVSVEWVRQALQCHGKSTIRRRVVPNEVVVWLVVGMALFRNLSIRGVLRHLRLAPHGQGGGWLGQRSVGSDTLTKARQRVGAAPLEELFHICSRAWAAEVEPLWRYRDLQVCIVDGTTLRVADTEANEARFGRPGSAHSPAAYPQLRCVMLLAAAARIVLDVVFDSIRCAEQTLWQRLFERLPAQSLVLFDRGFVNYTMFARINALGNERYWLCRARRNLRCDVLQEFGVGDALVRLKVPSKARKADPTLPRTITARLISYTIAGKGPFLLLTSLLDPERFPADELATLYHQRWEVELAYGEIKSSMLNDEPTLRSHKPETVEQELWGIFIAYNLVRIAMARAAQQANVPPARISFVNALALVRNFLLLAPAVAPSKLPKLYQQMITEIAQNILPKRRYRSYPRAVKIKTSKYPRKPPKGHGSA